MKSWRISVSLVAVSAAVAFASCKARTDLEGSGVKVAPEDRSNTGDPIAYVASTVPEPQLKQQLNTNVKARRDFAWAAVKQFVRGQQVTVNNQRVTYPAWYLMYDAHQEFSVVADTYAKYMRGSGAAAAATAAMNDYLRTERHAPNAANKRPFENTLGVMRMAPNGQVPGISGKGIPVEVINPATGFNLYSRSFFEHVLTESRNLVNCKDPRTDRPVTEDNFATCMSAEFPRDAVMLKTAWLDPNEHGGVNVYDFKADKIRAMWDEPRQHKPYGKVMPRPGTIFAADHQGKTQVLEAIHFSTKDVREWVWISLWWSDKPNEDFGADRPADMPAPWNNYKMCVTTGFAEGDPNPGSHYMNNPRTRGLGETLNAFNAGGLSEGIQWCANPFLETLPGHTPTNCIGCHQGADPRPKGDFYWSFYNIHQGAMKNGGNPGGLYKKNPWNKLANVYGGNANEPRAAFPDDFSFTISESFRPDLRRIYGMPEMPVTGAGVRSSYTLQNIPNFGPND